MYDKFDIKNKLSFETAANVDINFLVYVDTLSIEKLTKLPHYYNCFNIRNEKETIEVLNVNKL